MANKGKEGVKTTVPTQIGHTVEKVAINFQGSLRARLHWIVPFWLMKS